LLLIFIVLADDVVGFVGLSRTVQAYTVRISEATGGGVLHRRDDLDRMLERVSRADAETVAVAADRPSAT
jgi:hypothetical protein